MISKAARLSVSTFVLGCALSQAAPALAQSRQVTTPNTTTAEGTVNVSLNGDVFANQGLIGVGRVDSGVRDFAGETLGSFSGMALDLKSWRRNADGSYQGTLYTLPDRGPNDVGPFVGTTDYRNRVHISQLTLRPTTVTTPLPQATSSQNQLTITPTGGFFLTDTTGTNFTGKDALGNVVTRNGALYPLVAAGGEGAGRVSLDSEAIAFRPDGSFYVSDEYAANIYYFGASGQQIGVLNTIPAILPRIGGVVNYTGAVSPETGRRNNQGLEALAITPDNKKLVTILQSATVQDTNGTNQQTRNNTRVLVYDISSNSIPAANPIGHYVLQLPTFTNNGGGGGVNRTAAQSEMMALNSNQFLVLSRDGNGRGSGSNNGIVFKSILLVDTTGATNLAGSQYETGTTPVATSGQLASGIVPVSQVELVNMINPVQLNKFGMNLSTNPSTITSLSEKWEALALAPVLEESKPQDFFLFVGNDNDFQTANGFINGQAYDASLTGSGGTGSNDSVILVYRLSLPTYVDPQALQALNETAPNLLYGSRLSANTLALTASLPAMRFVNSQRGLETLEAGRTQIWMEGEWTKIGGGANPLAGLDADTTGMTFGIDHRASDVVRFGVFGGVRKLDGVLASGSPVDARAWTIGGYAGLSLSNGLYAQASFGKMGDLDFRQLQRPSAYGQIAQGSTSGDGLAASGELGWLTQMGRISMGPFAAIDYTDVELKGYTETEASVSNLVFPDRSFRKLTASFGAEVAAQIGAIKPSLRGGYSIENEKGEASALVKLASAKHSMGSVVLPLADTERNSAFGEMRINMQRGSMTAYIAGKGRWGRGDDDARVTIGFGYGF